MHTLCSICTHNVTDTHILVYRSFSFDKVSHDVIVILFEGLQFGAILNGASVLCYMISEDTLQLVLSEDVPAKLY
jgi:hypothetical protein